MECNKDEATRAKEIAERKFIAKDTLGAKKFALKAQNLFPALEGIPQLIATLDVYISAENKINGETDWYGILGANPYADDDTVRKHYRKLALMLHPDKNKSVGADGAFKLISEAWSLLSDKSRRAAYDDKRKGKARKDSTMFGGSSAKKGANGSFNFTKTTSSSAKTQKNTAKENTSSSTHKSKPTFWTTCNRCKMQYEYLKVYLNLKLLCPNCNEAFLAKETEPPPASGIRPGASWSFSKNQQKFNGQAPNKSKSSAGNSNTSFQWTPFSKTSGVSNAAQAANVVQQAYHKVKRDREEAQAATKREEALKRKQNVSRKGYFNPAKRRKGGMEEPVNQMGRKGSFGYNGDVSLIELQNLLMEKARKEISKKLKETQSNTVNKSVVKESGNCFQKANENREKSVRNFETCAQNNIGKSEDRQSGLLVEISTNFLDAMLVDVPDPDFHDFYKDRTERSFGENQNQIWAAYDHDDGMPRCYAMVHNVISLNPFKIQISLLNPNTNSELGSLNWVASGFSKTCGDFRIGRHEICNSIHFFSHKVRWREGNDGAIRIYPRKGDIWAIYRNWSPDWNELTADEVMHKFDVVEVLEDFSEEHGVTIIPLVKVAGFKTVFHHHIDPREIRVIPREEMLRFSHQVPSCLLTGLEAQNAPKGCRVLDPAATPFELHQVIEVVEEEYMVDNGDGVMKETCDKNKEASCEQLISDVGKHGEGKEGKSKDIQEIEILKEQGGCLAC
ncbi:uncharacterized protein LOC130738478 [Lotus japonicus]|uniref:uncharacterized protein LOC130738478 n=1 Tax=Lotus japonicus TaxID=34305 RepID=UPI00258972B1|nr:uncharacterized protein LOC130738478 [Lotus japonicus]